MAASTGFAPRAWLARGYGYEVTSLDVRDAYRATLAAAERHGTRDEVKERVRALAAEDGTPDRFVLKALERELS